MRTEHPIRGNWGTLLLPIRADDSIDWSVLADEIDLLIGADVDGIYSNGTAGEFYNQTEDEFDRISLLLADKCRAAGMPFQIGVSHMSPVISLERLRRTRSLAPAAFQVILPDWFPASEPEMIDFLNRMGDEAAPIKLVLYNPPHAKRVLAPEQLIRVLDAAPCVAGVKVADGDADWYRAMEPTMERWSVFVPGHHLATGFSRGAAGAYSNVACLSPRGAQNWYGTMETDLPSALELESRIRRFMDAYAAPFITGKGYMNGAVDKLLCVAGAWSGLTCRMRWPYRSIPDDDAAALRAVARNALPELFARSTSRPPRARSAPPA
jgi:dihydrodipicolinate synthase/N-acetylneuraminate lyase